MKEVWKDIPEYEGLYQVSNLGQVRSIGRATTKGKILKPDEVNGYLRVMLSKNNIRKNFLVHRLVANTFICEMDDTMQVNHKDFNRKNNTPKNLEWVTRKENVNHFRRSKKAKVRDEKFMGLNNPKVKLSLDEISLISKLRNEYHIQVKTLACLFDVH